MIAGLLIVAAVLGGDMINVRRSGDRGHSKETWLISHHSFSFGEYHDPAHMGFRTLRVINDDRIAPEGGFGTHPHRDMEILTYVLDGSLEHQDTIGNSSKIRPGELQLMSAGKGIQHSEFNPSESESVHLLQIWIQPAKKSLSPSYQQKSFPERDRKNSFKLVASPEGREESMVIHQDAEVYLASFDEGSDIAWPLKSGRGAWIQVTRGEITISGIRLQAGDGVSIEKEKELKIHADSNAEFLLFDLR